MISDKQIGIPGKLDYRARKKVMLAFGNYNSSKIYLTLYSYYKNKGKLRNRYCSVLDVQFLYRLNYQVSLLLYTASVLRRWPQYLYFYMAFLLIG
jgi:hypothetical protein